MTFIMDVDYLLRQQGTFAAIKHIPAFAFALLCGP